MENFPFINFFGHCESDAPRLLFITESLALNRVLITVQLLLLLLRLRSELLLNIDVRVEVHGLHL